MITLLTVCESVGSKYYNDNDDNDDCDYQVEDDDDNDDKVTMMTKPPVCECETIPTCLTVHCFTRHHMLKLTILNKMTVMMHGVIVASHCFKY